MLCAVMVCGAMHSAIQHSARHPQQALLLIPCPRYRSSNVVVDPNLEETLSRMRQELRRGLLSIAVLAALRNEQYGYSLRKKLLDVGLDIEEGTLYPLVRRLETQGLLESEWRDSGQRRKRYYRTSTSGEFALNALRRDWDDIVGTIGALTEEKS
jgi:PadR family transcriptional regulator PadR